MKISQQNNVPNWVILQKVKQDDDNKEKPF